MKTVFWIAIIAVGLGGSIGLQRWRESVGGEALRADEELYIKSGTALRKASLGFNGIIADIYWMRTIQYFGEKSLLQNGQTINVSNVANWKLKLLEPLIRVTTDLDPNYLAAYRFGALFLPDIDPRAAISLARRAITDNPGDWRLYQDLAFIHWKLHQYAEASEVYAKGAAIERAPKWMGQMAAVMVAKGGDRETARQMFRQIYETTDDPAIRRTSFNRLMYFRAEDEVVYLNRLLAEYRAEAGSCVSSLAGLMKATPLSMKQSMQRGGMNFDSSQVPVDPFGEPYGFDPATCAVSIAANAQVARWKD